MPPGPTPTLVTHGGKFHCDEVFAYAVLRQALGLRAPGEDHALVRTRDRAVIEGADIVWDVGFVYDPASSRFDHHQRGAPLRASGTPFSSAGLIWRVHGERAVAALLRTGTDKGDAANEGATGGIAAAIAAELDETVVRHIDETDNGVAATDNRRPGAMELATLIGEFNPTWDDPAGSGPEAGDKAFLEATALATVVLRRRVEGIRARLAAEASVLAAHRAGEDPRILVLDQGMPWKNAVFSHDLPVLFAVSPASNGNWMVDAMPPEPGSFAQRLPFPEDWAGLETEALAAQCGITDAVFVHLRRFVAAARSREGAVALARRAISLG